MAVSTPLPHPYIAALLAGAHNAPAVPLPWLAQRRAAALERANALTVPTTRDEAWRFTDLSGLTRTPVQPAARTDVTPALGAFRVAEAAVTLVVIDGCFTAGLSSVPALPAGCYVGALEDSLPASPAAEAHLARIAHFENRVFTAVNTAQLRSGVLVHVPRGVALPGPIHIIYVATQAQTAAYPRALIVAESSAQVTVVEDYVGVADAGYFTNAVTEVSVGANAQVRHVRLQREAGKAFHIGACAVTLARDAQYNAQSVALGARMSRYDLAVTLAAEGALAQLDGLALIGGRQHADTSAEIDHAAANTRSLQLHKTIVADAAHAVFSGCIQVREGAQLTDAQQQSRNLLLSDKARVDTRPQLEIFADDVKCAHGAAVGQIDAEQLFYLRSRGLAEARARNLLTYAFGAEVIERIPLRSLVAALERSVLERTGAEL